MAAEVVWGVDDGLGAITAVAGLTSGVVVVGGLGLLGAAAMHRWVPRGPVP
ncbi:MAG: hypothetical protein WD794_15075 [Mycobacteriales bacterium]